MCVTVVRFTPIEKRTVEQYAALLRQVMPVFANAAGLKRKYFIKTEQGSAGIYEWESEQHARDFYNDAWRAQMEELAGDSLTLEYTQINAILDNVSGSVDYRI